MVDVEIKFIFELAGGITHQVFKVNDKHFVTDALAAASRYENDFIYIDIPDGKQLVFKRDNVGMVIMSEAVDKP